MRIDFTHPTPKILGVQLVAEDKVYCDECDKFHPIEELKVIYNYNEKYHADSSHDKLIALACPYGINGGENDYLITIGSLKV